MTYGNLSFEYLFSSASNFASLQAMTLTLANFYLLKAEEKEMLCRDESFEGFLFYPNIFLQF
jgi:hypothetical protein